MSALRIETAEVFEPLLAPARDKAAHGGRGSGKSHFFAGLLVEDSLAEPGESGGAGLLSVCIREVQKDLAQSSKRLIESKLAYHGLGEADGFKVYRDVIKTPGDGIIIFKGMNDYSADSIKSLGGSSEAGGRRRTARPPRASGSIGPPCGPRVRNGGGAGTVGTRRTLSTRCSAAPNAQPGRSLSRPTGPTIRGGRRSLSRSGSTPSALSLTSTHTFGTGTTGHRSLKEVERYTRAADQRISAEAAMRKIQKTDPERKTV